MIIKLRSLIYRVRTLAEVCDRLACHQGGLEILHRFMLQKLRGINSGMMNHFHCMQTLPYLLLQIGISWLIYRFLNE